MIEFMKSGPDTWTARNGNYVIVRPEPRKYIVKDGHGREITSAATLNWAKKFATADQDGE